jgi:hypothetical protein
MMNVDVTLKEIEYAFDSIKADGINLQATTATSGLGDAITSRCWRSEPPQGCGLRASAGRRLLRPPQHPDVPAVIEVPHDTTPHGDEPAADRIVQRRFPRHQV